MMNVRQLVDRAPLAALRKDDLDQPLDKSSSIEVLRCSTAGVSHGLTVEVMNTSFVEIRRCLASNRLAHFASPEPVPRQVMMRR